MTNEQVGLKDATLDEADASGRLGGDEAATRRPVEDADPPVTDAGLMAGLRTMIDHVVGVGQDDFLAIIADVEDFALQSPGSFAIICERAPIVHVVRKGEGSLRSLENEHFARLPVVVQNHTHAPARDPAPRLFNALRAFGNDSGERVESFGEVPLTGIFPHALEALPPTVDVYFQCHDEIPPARKVS